MINWFACCIMNLVREERGRSARKKKEREEFEEFVLLFVLKMERETLFK